MRWQSGITRQNQTGQQASHRVNLKPWGQRQGLSLSVCEVISVPGHRQIWAKNTFTCFCQCHLFLMNIEFLSTQYSQLNIPQSYLPKKVLLSCQQTELSAKEFMTLFRKYKTILLNRVDIFIPYFAWYSLEI